MRGVAVFVTLLLSSALGTTWVDVPGGVDPNATLPAAAAPYGEVIANSSGAANPSAPTPPVPGFLPLPLHYVYLDPGYYSVSEYPWRTRYSGFREQHLYLAGEIGRGGTIDQIALFKTHYDDAATFPNVTVKMCHTSVTSLSFTFDHNYGAGTPVWVFHQDSGFVRGGEPDVWDAVDLQTTTVPTTCWSKSCGRALRPASPPTVGTAMPSPAFGVQVRGTSPTRWLRKPTP